MPWVFATMDSAARNRRGILLMVAAMACYALNDAFVKLSTLQFRPGQIMAVRGLFATAMVAAIAFNAGELKNWRTLLRPVVGWRSLIEITTAASSVAALALAPLATVTVFMMTAPLMITVCAMVLGWERPRGLRVLAAAIGFAGVLLVVQPSGASTWPGWGKDNIKLSLFFSSSATSSSYSYRCSSSYAKFFLDCFYKVV